MLTHYCKVALRNLARQKVLASINVFGLSIGLACFILFLLYAVHEFSYDRFHKRGADIYRVYEWGEGMPGREPSGEAGLSMGMGPALAQDFPDVEHSIRVRSRDNSFVKAGDHTFRLSVSYADPSFFSVFYFPLISGRASDVLQAPNSVVLTKKTALQLFGNQDPIGKIVQVKRDTTYTSFLVSGVAEDLPSNSIFSFGMVISYGYVLAHADKQALTDWYETAGDETYVMLRPGSTLAADRKRMESFRARHLPGEAADLIKNKLWDGKSRYPITFRFQPLRNIHLNPVIDGSGDPVDPSHVWLLIGMAASVLLIACINFTTLSIGRSAGRAKEIGVRKVIGSNRRQLVYQFLAEALMLAFVSFLLALIAVYLLLPFIDHLTGSVLYFNIHQSPELIWLLAGLVLLTGFVAGAYPALVLSGFKPLEVLKSKVKLSGANFFTRSLVVLQFVLSAGLVTSTVIILQQLAFMRSMKLGFQKENVIDVDASGINTARLYPLLKQTILSNSGVKGVTATQIGLGEGNGYMMSGYSYRGQGGGAIEYPVDPGYLDVLGIQLLSGRDFSSQVSSDSTHAVIVNQTLLQEFKISPDQALGQSISKPDDAGKDISYTIIGVVKDFNFTSLSQKVGPQLFFWPAHLTTNHIYVRVASGDPSAVLAFLGSTWKQHVPGLPFQYSFLDEEMNRYYKSETKWGQLIGWAGGISICLACLGLFGLAALIAVNRNKEVGIRKVLGASVSSIVQLLSLEFSRLVLVSLLIAVPLAWYFTHRWLQAYAYHISVSWWVFALTGTLTMIVALATVSFHAVKAALGNPVNSLRSE